MSVEPVSVSTQEFPEKYFQILAGAVAHISRIPQPQREKTLHLIIIDALSVTWSVHQVLQTKPHTKLKKERYTVNSDSLAFLDMINYNK